MRKYATICAVMLLLLSLTFVLFTSQVSLIKIIATDKMAQFVLFNSILLLGVGIFFAVFHDRLKIYLENYRREKNI